MSLTFKDVIYFLQIKVYLSQIAYGFDQNCSKEVKNSV